MGRKGKNYLAVLAMLAAVLCGPALWAQPAGEEESFSLKQLELMAQEPPLTQADIDFFIALANIEEDAAEALVEESGLGEARLTLILTKVSIGMMVASGAPASMVMTDDLPDVFRPSEAEMKLIAANLDKLVESSE